MGHGTVVMMGRHVLSAPSFGEGRARGLVLNFSMPAEVVDIRSHSSSITSMLLDDGRVYLSRRYSEGDPVISSEDAGAIAPRLVPLPGPAAQVLDLSETSGSVVMRDGTVLGWGGGGPQQPDPNLTDVAYIGQGSMFACALSRHGRVRCWGSSDQGELGIGIIDDPLRLDRPPPIVMRPPGPEVDLPPVRELGVGYSHACVLTMSDEVYCWGDTRGGAVGNGTTLRGQPTPVRLTLPP